ncbi:acyl-CoA synthetase [Georgenia halophila]|uniref:Acyl-CoA synthetase n=1 Tax=Georgenia halophila TaxID=620889 RepID=A0ABP8LNJ2_9MICO
MRTYGEVWRQVAAAVPERTAVVSAAGPMSYRRLEGDAARLAGLLRHHGVGHGDKVAIYSYNCPEYLVTVFAALTLGAAPVPVNFRYRSNEALPLLEDCGAVALVYPRSLAAVVREVEPRATSLRLLLEIPDDTPDGMPEDRADEPGHAPAVAGAVPFHALTEAPEHRPEPMPDDGELLLYTGGTTGRPKAVVWSVAELFEVQQYATYGTLGLPVPTTVDEVVDIARDPATPRTVVMPLAPFMHGTALFNSMNVLTLGGTVSVLASARLDAAEAVRLVREHGVTRLVVAGDSVARPFLDAVEASSEAGLPSLSSVLSSGMRLSDDTKARLHALGDVTVSDFLASTEGGPYAVAVSRSAEDLPARLRLFPDAVVLDERREEIQHRVGAVGTLAFRGALPKGYLGDPEKTAETFPVIRGRRHVAPGDYVEVLADGYVELLGRGSSVVNTGGEKIYPAEVEEALMSHPDVTDAVVVGVPDEKWGEAVTAVVAVVGSTVTGEELIRHVGTQLAGYKKPKRVVLHERLERSPTGKLDMRALRAELGR